MMFSTTKTMALSALLLGATLTSAFKVPEGQGAGSYHAYYDEQGNEVHEEIDESDWTIKDAPAPVSRVKRGSNPLPSGCYPSCNPWVVDQQDFYLQAYNKFWAQCSNAGDTTKQWGSFYAQTAQGTIAYMCNYSSGGNPCNVDEWDESVNQITGKCTNENLNFIQAGWESVPAWKKVYGFISSNEQFCNDAKNHR